MEICLPENIDLSCSENYLLTIEVYQEQFFVSLCSAEEKERHFRFPAPDKPSANAFSLFRDMFFNHSFFTLPFKKTIVLNHTSVYTFVPCSIYEEKDKEEYMRFLFTTTDGKILEQKLSQSEVMLLHEIPEKIFDFFQRSFAEVQWIHSAAALMTWFQDKGQTISSNRMLVNRKVGGIDILCFSRENLLLSNYFPCSGANDALYYILNAWKQLKFSQKDDFLYLAAENDLQEKLKPYIRKLVPADLPDIYFYADC